MHACYRGWMRSLRRLCITGPLVAAASGAPSLAGFSIPLGVAARASSSSSSSSSFSAADSGGGAKPDDGAQYLDGHYVPSTEEPLRTQRTQEEEELWGPIMNTHRSRGAGQGGGHMNTNSGGGAGVSSSGSIPTCTGGSVTGGGGVGGRYAADDAATSTSTSTSSSPSSGASARQQHHSTTTMFVPFMGSSTRFRNPRLRGGVAITRRDIANLEREFLSHSPPSRINDHLCIFLTRALRWAADRAYRERYIHRATMLTTVGPAAPAAASVAAYIRMMTAPRRRLGRAPYVHADFAPSPLSRPAALFTAAPWASAAGGKKGRSSGWRGWLGALPFVGSGGAGGGGGRAAAAAAAATPTASTASAEPSAASRAPASNNYADELRGLFSQSECSAIHYQILVSMAEITAPERALVAVLQACQFAFFLCVFLLYPRMGFRLMGYMAEESSVVWTQMINDIDLGKIAEHHVPELALHYWGLQEHFVAQEALVPAVIPQRQLQSQHYQQPQAAPAALPVDDPQQQQHRSASPASPPPPDADEATGREGRGRGGVSEVGRATGQPPTAARGLGASTSSGSVVGGADATAGIDRLTLRDVVLLIRSDEMVFRDLNHRTADALDHTPREPGAIATYIRNKWMLRR